MSEWATTEKRSISTVGTLEFRNAMRQLAGGISVITVGDGERRSGLTVTSLSSLSAEPPVVIFCISRTSSSWPILSIDRAFAVNILAPEHIDIAERFSGKRGEKGTERYADASWSKLVTGAPVLTDAVAVLDCEVDELIERHGSAIVVGRVQSVKIRAEPGINEVLTYWRGTYGATRK
jgi:flavin reductase (DIM6/NTAB) family NADH-FMN oxidoreductase RutF